MPILSIKKTVSGVEVETSCGVCAEEQSTDLGALTLGNEIAPGVIALPPCGCGSMEFLQHTFDVHPEQARAEHRKKVNALAEHLKSSGRVHPRHADAIKAAPTPPQVGDLLGEVSDAALPAHVTAKRRSRRALLAAAASAGGAFAKAPQPGKAPDDPVAKAIRLFAEAQAALAAAGAAS
jgi:hypothetical protein